MLLFWNSNNCQTRKKMSLSSSDNVKKTCQINKWRQRMFNNFLIETHFFFYQLLNIHHLSDKKQKQQKKIFKNYSFPSLPLAKNSSKINFHSNQERKKIHTKVYQIMCVHSLLICTLFYSYANNNNDNKEINFHISFIRPENNYEKKNSISLPAQLSGN